MELAFSWLCPFSLYSVNSKQKSDISIFSVQSHLSITPTYKVSDLASLATIKRWFYLLL